LKGAATQCLQVRFLCVFFATDTEGLCFSGQNLNLALGYDEFAGIPTD